jgi:hypothetical protein
MQSANSNVFFLLFYIDYIFGSYKITAAAAAAAIYLPAAAATATAAAITVNKFQIT